MKKLYTWYDNSFGWPFRWFKNHPFIFIVVISLITINLITRGEYIWSTIYIVMLFFMVSLFIFTHIESLKRNSLLRRIALYLMLFVGFSYLLVRLLKLVPEDYLVVGVEDWLGFAGALFGGFIAIYGIWVTLDETRKQNAETLALQSIPLITFDVPAYFNEINGESISDIDDPEPAYISVKHYIRVPFSIDNKSNHIAKNFRFTSATYKIFHMVSDIDGIGNDIKSIDVDILSESNTQLDKISALPGGYSGKLFYMPEINLLKHDRLRFFFTLEYSDYLGQLSHSIECTTDILIDRKIRVENGKRKATIGYLAIPKNKFLY